MDGKVGEQAALGVGKLAGDEMETGERDDRVAETAEAKEEHFAD